MHEADRSGTFWEPESVLIYNKKILDTLLLYISSDGSDTIDVQSRIDSAARDAFGALSKCIF